MNQALLPLCVAASAFVGNVAADVPPIQGAGATFPAPVYAGWIDDYRRANARAPLITYDPVGSGQGVERIAKGVVDFGATDVALSPVALQEYSLMQFPVVIGAVAPVFNVTGIKSGDIKLDGAVLGDIYLGRITKWNDAALTALNPTLSLPNANITVVHRSDASGTTWLWSEYLSRFNPAWKAAVGTGETLAWPSGVAAQGNEGVASVVKRTRMSLGYVEYAYAVHHGLSVASLQNRAGRQVLPSLKSIEAVAADASWTRSADLTQPMVDQGSPTGWPIAAPTFILLPLNPAAAERTLEVLKFFDWSFDNGRSAARALDYAPMPDAAVELIRTEWRAAMKLQDNSPIWPALSFRRSTITLTSSVWGGVKGIEPCFVLHGTYDRSR